MAFLQSHLLSLILVTPLAGAAVLLVLGKERVSAIRWVATLAAALGVLLAVPLWFRFEPLAPPWHSPGRPSWIPSTGASYFLGVDGFSALLVLLTTLVGLIAVLSSWTA